MKVLALVTPIPDPDVNPSPAHEVGIYNETSLFVPLDQHTARQVLDNIKSGEHKDFAQIEVVYVTEEEIVRINREHLGKNYVTDIITFPYHESPSDPVEGTLFCCAHRIYEQSRDYEENDKTEFLRIFIHGVLHLCGYNDATDHEKSVMREKEDYYLKNLY